MLKTKALISFAVTAKLICVFVFAYAKKPVFSRRGSFTFIRRALFVHVPFAVLFGLLNVISRFNCVVCVFSSPEPLGSQGELIVYPSSRRPSSVRRRRRKQFQTSSSPKPLGRSEPNFMWSLLG